MSALRQLAKRIRRKISPPRGVPAVGSVEEVAAVYDDVFTNDPGFDTLDISNKPKLKYVDAYTSRTPGKIVDAGCGRGSVLRHMLDNGVDAFGVEISQAACEMYLQDLPHVNSDIIAWAEQGHRYDGLVCLDVLEHIPIDQIDGVLASIAKLAPSGFLGIANHSSIHNGHELHVIQKGRKWWKAKLAEHFNDIQLIPPHPEDTVLVGHLKADRFFFYEVA